MFSSSSPPPRWHDFNKSRLQKCPIFLDTRDQCIPGPLLPVPEPLNREKALGTRLTLDQLCNPCGPTMLPPPHVINLFISKLLQNVKSCVTPTPIGYYLFIFRHNSKKYRSRISFLCCKLLQIWMKHWLFCTYNGWPEFNEIQMVKPRRNYVNRIELRSVKCEWNL